MIFGIFIMDWKITTCNQLFFFAFLSFSTSSPRWSLPFKMQIPWAGWQSLFFNLHLPTSLRGQSKLIFILKLIKLMIFSQTLNHLKSKY